MKKLPVRQFAIATLVSAVLSGCVGMGDHVHPKSITSNSESVSARLGATNATLVGKVKQLVMTDATEGDMFKMIAIQGGPEDKGGGTALDVWGPERGAGIYMQSKDKNEKTKITVVSKSFQPRVLVLERVSGISLTDAALVEGKYFQVLSADIVSSVGGNNIVAATYTAPKDGKRTSAGTVFDTVGRPVIGVLSADGRTGDYTIKTEYIKE